MLLGCVDSGKSLLTVVIAGGEGDRKNALCREVDVKLTPEEPGTRVRVFEPAAVGRNRVCLDIVRGESAETCFVVVVDINKSIAFVDELVGLRELSEYLSDWSYSLFGNCMIVFTHIDELAAEVNRDRWVQQEFNEILSLVDNKCVFLDCTDGSQGNRNLALENIMQLSKPAFNVLCYGNTQCPSSCLQDVIEMYEFSAQINTSGLQFHYHPDQSAHDVDITREFNLSPNLIRIIGHADSTGTGISVFVILISLTISYHIAYEALINQFPARNKLNADCEKYFWNRVVVIFQMNEGNYPSVIKHSIDNNSAIMSLLIRAGWRYTYMGKYRPNNIFVDEFISLCHRVREENNNRQFVGGRDVNERAIRDITARREEMTLQYRIFKFARRHNRTILLAMFLLSTPVIYRIFSVTSRHISKLLNFRD